MRRHECRAIRVSGHYGLTQLIPKDRIEKQNTFKRSLMYDPSTLGLTAQDIADIAAWLQSYR